MDRRQFKCRFYAMKFLRELYYLYFRFGESALMLLENKYFTKSLHRNWRHWLFNPTEWQNKCQNKKLNDRINRKGTMKLYRFTLASEKTEGSKPSLDVLDSFSLPSDVPLVFLGYGEISAGTGFLAYYSWWSASTKSFTEYTLILTVQTSTVISNRI